MLSFANITWIIVLNVFIVYFSENKRVFSWTLSPLNFVSLFFSNEGVYFFSMFPDEQTNLDRLDNLLKVT